MPRSRTPKGRRQAESRHSCKAYLRITSRPQNGRDSRTLQQIHTSPSTKNFPHVPATLQKRTKSSLRKRRGHGGSSGRMREVWREKEPHPKGGSFSLQGLSPIPFPLTLPEYQTHNVPTGDGIPRASEDRRSSNRCQPACNQHLHRSRTAESDRNRALSRSVARARSASS